MRGSAASRWTPRPSHSPPYEPDAHLSPARYKSDAHLSPLRTNRTHISPPCRASRAHLSPCPRRDATLREDEPVAPLSLHVPNGSAQHVPWRPANTLPSRPGPRPLSEPEPLYTRRLRRWWRASRGSLATSKRGERPPQPAWAGGYALLGNVVAAVSGRGAAEFPGEGAGGSVRGHGSWCPLPPLLRDIDPGRMKC